MKCFLRNILLLLFFKLTLSINALAQNEVSAISGGHWSDPTIWSNQKVPTKLDNVDLKDYTVFLILPQGVDTLFVCNNLNIDQAGNLLIGHDEEAEKWIGINGNIHCDGTIAQGRGESSMESESFLHPYNSNLIINTNSATSITGKGYINPKNLVLSGTESSTLTIDHYNMVVDGDFNIINTSTQEVDFTAYTFLKVYGSLGISGGRDQKWLNKTPIVFTTEGVIVCENLDLYSKNGSIQSSIYIKNGGSISTKTVNHTNEWVESGNKGFQLKIARTGLLRLGEDALHPETIQNEEELFQVLNYGEIRTHFKNHIESYDSMMVQIEPYKPENYENATEYKHVIGASHIGGWYNFTEKPYLIEGLDMFKEFGSTAFKTSLTCGWQKMHAHYPFNHDWPNQFNTMTGLAKYHLMDTLFSDEEIKTHAVWANPNFGDYYKEGPDKNNDIYAQEEEQFFQLTVHLLETYGDMDKRFVLQNWEGDWMLRGSTRNWEKEPETIPVDIRWRVDGMGRMFRSRMRGVEKARALYPEANAEVLFSVEFNKLFYRKDGEYTNMIELEVPNLIEQVIPQMRLDISSWSSYDGRWLQEIEVFPYGFLNGIRIAEYFTTSAHFVNEGTPVMLGEFGMNENEPYIPKQYEREELPEMFSDLLGLVKYTGVQQVYLWNFFSSGDQAFEFEKGEQYELDTLYKYLDGKWVVEPDQSYGTVGAYLEEIFNEDEIKDPTSTEDNFVKTSIFPNPAEGEIYITSEALIEEVLIYSTTGILYNRQALDNTNKINVSQLPPGHFLIRIITNKGQSTHQLIKK
ncbi:T9SS type A sorting domain-containing protein [Flammeovirga agarivorans]|uniref:T9SS type A sorting domain-containing protein n=1 Tax=Flammeovirga agarivorans TaxID=2726742 RepID=A0A7X8SK76_9BACT|nr:T9SS type A sorting domain-containing protein [Flammeovirga agarivorans]NLR91753.1 T9SS type A sorting domain-containing protein [Flammeovirga agarivorans]